MKIGLSCGSILIGPSRSWRTSLGMVLLRFDLGFYAGLGVASSVSLTMSSAGACWSGDGALVAAPGS